MEKIDIHVHSALEAYKLPFGNPYDLESHYVSITEELKNALKKKGIISAILMSAGEYEDINCNTLGAYNKDCIEICNKDSFFYWMCNVNPVDDETLENRIIQYKNAGAVGIGEVMINEWMDSPFLSHLFEIAEKQELPVLCHMSPEPGFSYGVCDKAGLPLMEQTLIKYPSLKLIGHSQLFWNEISADCPKQGNKERCTYGQGKVIPGGRLEQLFEQYSNLYGDLSAYSAFCALTRDEEYGLAFIHRFADRLMYATDATNERNIPPMADKLDQWLLEGKLCQEDYEKVCYRNAHSFFNI